jgi:DNA modification methylase
MKTITINGCTLIHGDCYEYIKKMPDLSIDLIHSDPPYICHSSMPDTTKLEMIKKVGKFFNNLEDADITDGFNYEIFTEFERICKAPNYQLWCSKKQFMDYMLMANDKKWNWQDVCLYRNNALPTVNGKYQDKDYLIHLWKGRTLTGEYTDKRTNYNWSIGGTKDFAHPALKPVEPIVHLLRVGSNAGDTVFDPFMESGTTGIACIQTDRNFIGIEKDETFFNMAVERISDYKKRKFGFSLQL